MQNPDLNRRDFHKLAMAALSGAVAGAVSTGAMSGCSDAQPPKPAGGGTPAATPASTAAPAPVKDEKQAAEKPDPSKPDGPELVAANADVHVCRGLNACKGKGADGKNACAGQGTCASAATHHSCGSQNACKNQGGCGDTAAQNSCKGEGGCHVPLMDSAWKTARKHFEETLKKQDKEFGAAPPKKAKT